MSDDGWYDHTLPRREQDREREWDTWERILARQRLAQAAQRARQRAEVADRGETASDESERESRRG